MSIGSNIVSYLVLPFMNVTPFFCETLLITSWIVGTVWAVSYTIVAAFWGTGTLSYTLGGASYEFGGFNNFIICYSFRFSMSGTFNCITILFVIPGFLNPFSMLSLVTRLCALLIISAKSGLYSLKFNSFFGSVLCSYSSRFCLHHKQYSYR